jgi:hypothetical protein
MSELVAVDSTSPPGGDQNFVVGVVVEIDDVDEFRDNYFEAVRGFVRDYEIEIPFPSVS